MEFFNGAQMKYLNRVKIRPSGILNKNSMKLIKDPTFVSCSSQTDHCFSVGMPDNIGRPMLSARY